MPFSRRDFLQMMTAVGVGHVFGSHSRLCWGEETDGGLSVAEWPDNPFLQGNYAPVHEETTAERLKVIGKLPAGLEGMFVRNGPNPQFPPQGKYHWFDGDGMVHGVHLRDGQASYRNRYVRTAGFEAECSAGKALWRGLLETPDLNRVLEGGELQKNTANTALVWHDGQMLALWEGGPPYELRLPGLETVGKFTYGDKLTHPFTAHPKIDHETGEMIFFGYQVTSPYLQQSIVAADGTLTHTTGIELPRPVMMHDFAITKNYSLFLDLPVTLSIARSMRGEPALKYEPDLNARVGVLPRYGKSEEIRWFEVEPCCVFHTLNAFEVGEKVVLDACRMPTFPDLLAKEATGKAMDPASNYPVAPKLHRWTFDLSQGETVEESLDDRPVEFPRLNDRMLGQSARYGYTLSVESAGLAKYDLQRGTRSDHDHGQGREGGEGVFVPKPDATAEDDGWLLTYVYDQAENRSELVVVDAQDMTAPPVARVMIPTRIPFGFHGVWVSAESMSRQVS